MAGLPADRRRSLKDSVASQPGRIRRGERELVDFASNDYLGLAHHPELKDRSAQWAREYGAGLAASRLITGNHPAYRRLEQRIAELKGTEAALIFGSGFQANSSVLAALLSPKLHGTDPKHRNKPAVQVFCDRLNHASFHFGIAAAGVSQIRYRHNDLEHLDQRLRQYSHRETTPLIATESIFSMDGDEVDVAKIREIAERYDAFLYVDEAHASGVAGSQGMGLFASSAETKPRPAELLLGTFSKALGSFGAYVACTEAVREYLVQTCPGFIYSTALPPAVLGAIEAALEIVPTMDAQRRHLKYLADRLRTGLQAAGFDTLNSTTQIVPVVIGSDHQTLLTAQRLEERGFVVGAIRPPTVPDGSARLRISLSAAHSEEDVDGLLTALQEIAAEAPDA
jgi:8-amino-7-oxononanoate synthase